jgi:Lrp/AsnC family leucine-responsive transcriptional regulator
MAMDLQLDRLDVRILSALQVSNQTSAHELADSVPLSPSAIQRRIRHYRSNGMITADVSVLNPRLAGDHISVMVMIQLAQQGLARVADVRARLSRSPHVQVVMEIAGAYDLMCITVFDAMEAFNAFVDAEIADHPSVGRFETVFIRRRVKFGATIPL